ncbi:MAG: SIMPL domain-containing protein [Methyloceanibacter sp.]|jgi:uncharacterized protein YggE|uniref:SIMPL domain-containing protein n=1 Tax=Methyloceanibacter sp. TaxID=1965321 RepID=UPI003C69CC17
MTLAASLRFVVPALAILAASAPMSATAAPAKRSISLSASGMVKAAPDMASITTGVTSEGQTAQDALSKNTNAMTEVVGTLKETGIEPKDIQTTDFNVSPVYEQKKNGQAAFVTGYRVSNKVHIIVRDTKKLGDVLDKVVAAGANQIGSISFGIAKPEKLKDEARKLAMRNAIDNAKLYADAAGIELGPVMTIAEDNGFTPRPYRGRAAPMMAEASPVPVEGGTLSVEAKIRVTWELR